MVRLSSPRSNLGSALLAVALGLALHRTAAGDPSVHFTHVPPHGAGPEDSLRGRVQGVDPLSCSVAVCIFVDGSGWWTKPFSAQPLTPVRPDSTWSCDFVTGGSDQYAIRIRAFIWANGIGSPPIVSGAETLPSIIDSFPHDDVIRPTRRVVVFHGDTWYVKTSAGPVGPGPNYFSDDDGNVWVDGDGKLHLKITHVGGNWYCPEVYRKNTRGYGPYVFALTGGIGRLDPNVVLGLFTWDNWSVPHREIDIEFSRWGSPGGENAQYVIQPWDIPGNRYQWMYPAELDSSTHSFNWQHDSVVFSSVRGSHSVPTGDSVLQTWRYTGPDTWGPGTSGARMNLWLFNGNPPTDSQEVELVVARFDTSFSLAGVAENERTALALRSSCPNPAHGQTTIRFALANAAEASLVVFDCGGRRIETVVTGRLPAGEHEIHWARPDLPSGVYLCQVQAGEYERISRVVLLR